MGYSTSKIIKIYKGNEFKIFSTDQKISEGDIFFDQYKKAWKSAEEIALQNIINQKQDQKGTLRKEYLNNIIAFCGERGQGKSSAMYAFVNELCMKNEKSHLTQYNEKKYETAIYNTKFISIDAIDPAILDRHNSILEIIISRIFKEYQRCLKMHADTVNSYQQREILNLFNNVYDNITTLNSSRKLGEADCSYGNGIQQLSRLEEAADLREHIKFLVKEFLKLYGQGSKEENFMLVIPIDDLDISIDSAYNMAEQIRKYLILPNILIVMAVRVEQLRYCVEKEFVQQLGSLNITRPDMIKQESEQMAGRYIDKLIPIARRYYLPNINVLAKEGIEIEYIDSDNNIIFSSNDTDDINIFILRMIFEKTGLVLYPRKEQLHLMVPNNLRALVSLLALFEKMESVNSNELMKDIAWYMRLSIKDSYKIENDDLDKSNEDKIIKNIDIIRNNLLLFKEYFLHTWAVNYLDGEHLMLLEKISEISYNQQHKYICNQLYQRMKGSYNKEVKDDIFGYGEDKKSISNSKTLIDKNRDYTNFSLADALNVLEYYSAYNNTPQAENFIAAIKILYSIEMHELIYHKQTKIDNRNELNQFLGDRIWSRERQEKMLRKDLRGRSRAFFKGNYKLEIDWMDYALFISFISKDDDATYYYKQKRREAFSGNRNLDNWVFALDNFLLTFADLDYSFYINQLGGTKKESDNKKERRDYYYYLLSENGMNININNVLLLVTNVELLEAIAERCYLTRDNEKSYSKETTDYYFSYINALNIVLYSVQNICNRSRVVFSVFHSNQNDIYLNKMAEICSSVFNLNDAFIQDQLKDLNILSTIGENIKIADLRNEWIPMFDSYIKKMRLDDPTMFYNQLEVINKLTQGRKTRIPKGVIDKCNVLISEINNEIQKYKQQSISFEQAQVSTDGYDSTGEVALTKEE